jgi:hypothetical protein
VLVYSGILRVGGEVNRYKHLTPFLIIIVFKIEVNRYKHLTPFLIIIVFKILLHSRYLIETNNHRYTVHKNFT